MYFKQIDAKELNENAFKLIGTDWMLISSGNENKFNTMTASWGGVGVLWGKNVSFVFIRPQRYTLEFVEKNDYYTLSFFSDEYRPALSLCGSKSGRDVDKVAETGLTPLFDNGVPYFGEAKLVLVCKKLYNQPLDPSCFVDKNLDSFYANNDYHKMFVGEIVKVLVKEQ